MSSEDLASRPARHAISRTIATLCGPRERLVPYTAAAFLLLVFCIAFLKALYKPLWFDEIISVLITKLDNSGAIWAIASSGTDGQPPIYDYIVRACVSLFRNDALGLRFPSIVGFVIFCWSLYLLATPRTSRVYGLISLILPALTGCWYYATEGRPYGLLLGAAGLAALSWQAVAVNESARLRNWALLALAASLAFALSIHYYAPLLIVSLGLAEVVRTFRRRKFDLAVWVAFAIPLLILIPYFPLIRSTRENSGEAVTWASPAWYRSILSTASDLLGPSLIVLIGMALIFFLYRLFAGERRGMSASMGTDPDVPWVEGCLAISFTLLPVFGVALSRWVTHVFFTRYVVAATLGLTLLITLSLWIVFSGRRAPALLIVLMLTAFFGYNAAHEVAAALGERSHPSMKDLQNRLPAEALNDSLPIVISDAFTLLDLRYYANPEFLGRIFYVSNEAAAKRVLGYTIGERIVKGGAPYFRMQVIDYKDFIRDHKVFDLFGAPEWLGTQLLADGARIRLLQYSWPQGGGGKFLFRVEIPPK